MKDISGFKFFIKHKTILITSVLLLFVLPVVVINLQNKTQQKGKAAGNFQPSSPYYATFFYPWYQNPNTDSIWSDWNDNGHTPPLNWFSNYLPDPNPSTFDPTTELYSSKNDQIIYWQLQKLAEAKQEIAISSWWGQGHKTDVVFRHIVTDVMNRPDNPYPNLRWAIYYEKEGFGNPTVAEIVSDLNYVQANYANQPSYFKINGKPVVFVYNAAHTGSNPLEDLSRWKQVRAQTGFYVVMKQDPLNVGANPADMDGWHEYAPAGAHYKERLPYYSFVSPGFWLNGQAERLTRDATAFETGVKQMVASNVNWKLTETWNEWGEGTSVEPGNQVNQTTTGQATLNAGGYPFKNLYVDILNRNLPPLPQGTGVVQTISPLPLTNPSNSPGKDIIIAAAGDIACNASGTTSPTKCQHKATSDLLKSINPNAVIMLGDDQYEAGVYSDYLSYYNPTWGQFKSITYPTIGNHQYGTPNVQGYFDYWNGVGNQTGKAGNRGEGWYSFDLGAWHFISLNAQCGNQPQNESLPGRIISEPNNCDKGAAQEVWLRADLEAHKNSACIAAFWHEPYWTSGSRGNALQGNGAQTFPFIQDLYNYHADLILVGHQHWYERFAKQDPNSISDITSGLREITVGTGGVETLNLGNPPVFLNREIRDTTSFGVLKMVLHSNSYDWQFVPVPGYSFTDSGSTTCNTKSSGTITFTPTPSVLPTPTNIPTPSYVTPTLYCLGSCPTLPPSVTPTPSNIVDTITPSDTISQNVISNTPQPNTTGQPSPTNIIPTSKPTPPGGHHNRQQGSLNKLIKELLQLILALLKLIQNLQK